ncbi:conodipine-P3-like [Haliotis rufescens]|uniref:conodipine-P3-like n=1 Tax=Haliotis rufescens TaxID=6454 RepID=UPI00201ECECE|nr:conodipine-P3-like [Haliotis rufescens]XP_048258489.1 conodipine-P3-like [Haliotis rufescens]
MMRLLYTWCALACVLLLTGDATARQTCDRNRYVNGCSVPYKWIPFKNTFRPACNRHDVCYSCAAAYGISKATCDRRFLRSMRQICSRSRLRNCRSTSFVYHFGVAVFGRRHFSKSVLPGCRDPWVRQCL